MKGGETRMDSVEIKTESSDWISGGNYIAVCENCGECFEDFNLSELEDGRFVCMACYYALSE